MKRVNWDSNSERNPQSRGKSRFKRISWDEATDMIAAGSNVFIINTAAMPSCSRTTAMASVKP